MGRKKISITESEATEEIENAITREEVVTELGEEAVKEIEENAEEIEVVPDEVKDEIKIEMSVMANEEESEAKKAFRALIEDYKKKNPTKYEAKKVELESKLNSL